MVLTNKNFVDMAEKVFEQRHSITTNKIRNILSTANLIYEKAKRNKGNLSDEELASIQILRMNLVYDSGRDENVKNFVKKAKLLEYLKNIENSRDELILYCRYLEALVAFHKYKGGK